MHCHLVIPDLFWPAPPEDAARFDPYQGLALPAIERLLARGRRHVGGLARPGGFEAWLANGFGLRAGRTALATYRALGDGLPDGIDQHWLAADPVHLQVSRDHLVLADLEPGPLEADESAALIASLDAHFAADGVKFVATSPTRWYLRLPAAAATRTTPLVTALGRPIEDYMPAGPEGARWRAFMNEAQMLLHSHPVNDARERRGAPTANSVWVWGSGGPGPSPSEAQDEDDGDETPVPLPGAATWVADDPLIGGFARRHGHAQSAPAASLSATLDRAADAAIVVVVLDGLRRAAAFGDLAAWQQGLAGIESAWAAPALAALQSRRLGMLTVHAPAATSVLRCEVTAGDLRRFWRRHRRLASYLAQP